MIKQKEDVIIFNYLLTLTEIEKLDAWKNEAVFISYEFIVILFKEWLQGTSFFCDEYFFKINLGKGIVWNSRQRV